MLVNKLWSQIHCSGIRMDFLFRLPVRMVLRMDNLQHQSRVH